MPRFFCLLWFEMGEGWSSGTHRWCCARRRLATRCILLVFIMLKAINKIVEMHERHWKLNERWPEQKMGICIGAIYTGRSSQIVRPALRSTGGSAIWVICHPYLLPMRHLKYLGDLHPLSLPIGSGGLFHLSDCMSHDKHCYEAMKWNCDGQNKRWESALVQYIQEDHPK